MARAKKSKRSAPRTRTSAKKSFNLSTWLRTNRLWLFVLVFAVAGTYYLVQTYASPKLPAYSDDIVAGYINLTPTLISQDESGNLTYEMYPATTIVQVDGTVVCDAGGSLGTVTTGTLSAGEVKKLQKDVIATSVTGLSDEIGTDNENAFVAYEGFMVADGSQAKGTAVYAGAQKPSSFSKAQATLQRACDKATLTVKRSEVKEPREPNLKRTNNKKSAFSGVTDLLFAKASACCSVGTRDSAFETAHAKSINDYRASKGRARLPRNACMDEKALNWSGQMAAAGKHSHSPNLAKDTAACYPNWKYTGENVGVGYDNTSLFNAFKASSSHNANMLNSIWKAMGIGAVKHPDKRIFVTQRYVQY